MDDIQVVSATGKDTSEQKKSDTFQKHLTRAIQPDPDTLALPFSYELNSRTTAQLIHHVTRKMMPDDVAAYNKLDPCWDAKTIYNTRKKLPQRCPFLWVDNFCFLAPKSLDSDEPKDREPRLLLGRFDKKGVCGLVVAAGGHVEVLGDKRIFAKDFQVESEQGDASLREAADKEVKEEVGIDPKNIVGTLHAASTEYRDPTALGMGHVFLRYVDQEDAVAKRSTKELQEIFSVPISMLKRLTGGEGLKSTRDGKVLQLVKGHDELITIVMNLPLTKAFLAAGLKYMRDKGRAPPAYV